MYEYGRAVDRDASASVVSRNCILVDEFPDTKDLVFVVFVSFVNGKDRRSYRPAIIEFCLVENVCVVSDRWVRCQRSVCSASLGKRMRVPDVATNECGYKARAIMARRTLLFLENNGSWAVKGGCIHLGRSKESRHPAAVNERGRV